MRFFINFLICLLLLPSMHAMRRTRPPRRLAQTHDAQLEQNQIIDQLGLIRIKNQKELNELIRSRYLVPLRESQALMLDRRLPTNRRYTLPCTEEFLRALSSSYFAEFGRPLVVTSAVRTVQVQRSLLRWNRNAAPIHGDTASSHMTGATVDIARTHMTKAEDAWMAYALYGYYIAGRVIYIREKTQACYHVMVIPYENWNDL